MNNDYHFTSQWRVEGTCGEVADVLDDPLSLRRWWPSVYLDVWEVRPSEERLRPERAAGREPGGAGPASESERRWDPASSEKERLRPERAAGREPGEAGPASESERRWDPASSDKSRVGQRVKLRTKSWLPYTLRWQSEVVESRYPNGFTLIATGDFEGRGEWTFVQNGDYVDMTYDWRLRAEKPLLRHLSFLLKPVFKANHRWAMARGEESLKIELARRRAGSKAARSAIPAPPGPVTYAAVGLLAGAAIVGGTLAYLVFRAMRRNSSE